MLPAGGRKKAASALTGRALAHARIIAKGWRIRDVLRLVRRCGGKPSQWVKKSGPPFDIADEQFEYHWYECPGVGKVELKRKRIAQP